MQNKKVINVEYGLSELVYVEWNADFCEELEVHIPSSLEKLAVNLVNSAFLKQVKVLFDGTKKDWDRIKKGLTKTTDNSDDWYGSYYHNAPSYSDQYFNWILFDNVTIVCSDGEFADDKEQNSFRPTRITDSSYWKAPYRL